MDQVVELSRRKIEQGSKSFAAAARLFDPATRADAYMLYAWCRHCDDVIDGQDLGHVRQGPADRAARPPREILAELEEQTRDALGGRASDPVFIALSRVVARHSVPHRHPLELLQGFRMDVEGRHYATIKDTLDYSYHVAGVVGVMMARIMGVRETGTLARAQDLGIAFQLTNIARDILDDARAGRVYLPGNWLREAGLAHADILDPARREALSGVANRLLDTAEDYYASARAGLPALPFRAAWAVASARVVYRAIGTVVRQRRSGAWERRAVVGGGGKVLALAAGLGAALASRVHGLAPARAEPRDPRLWTKPDLGDA